VKTGHEDKRRPRPIVKKFRAHLNDLAGSGLGRQGFVALALDLAGMTANAFLLVLQHEILTHYRPPQNRLRFYTLRARRFELN
jgi:hypothetical protein